MKDSLKRMLDTIAEEAKTTATFTGRKKFSEAVMQAINEVDRKKFVVERYLANAYDDGPLPIGHGQTISQPLCGMKMMKNNLAVNGNAD